MGENKNYKQQGHASVIILYATQELEKSLEMATKTNKTIVMAGDFNCPDINWEHLTVKSGSEKEVQQQIIETTTLASLTQIHDQPTRADNMLDWYLHQTHHLLKHH